MDSLQQEVTLVSQKIDALYQIVEQLSHKVNEGVSATRLDSERIAGRQYSSRKFSETNPSLEHKDILTDTNHAEVMQRGGEKSLAPEIQIQRLTAQLTAAYNRIAALEERLIAQRTH